MWAVTTNGYRVSLDKENVLKLDSGDGYITLCIYPQNTELHILK